ncbi:3-hydroxyacyl-[acyl-carrier-protein] dehydratase FabZ [Solemya pervernicosa gill symbiont]|uniref:3-hydroxyacyl-[acyl-carrier-protein] dehydratase FabZ n=2 Tax=Gammaproteobacteria incertae sedis TaxID=118884 RepID=A0A1T2L7Y2_9GAMM|nr:3-hydroxyacyl-ACP dehydratase FabZ [Candidatus Reidiella endopervernicosa]OOZ41191.1 3-hydroxyacyl-[acyl-carrier-protein] dehydratase FabZ [Solemya pervernicosa gill symbiont]QKQ27084.1 3-hydroxyacyl-ACP dehydratase FabZ [Candidatus Reidiella endopervernicosa]
METIEINEVMKLLPHRYPFLLIDRVLNIVPGETLTALKNVTVNEPFFPGHFPQKPIMPGVLILEAMAQATGLLAFRTEEQPEERNTLYYFVGIDKARFKKPVGPGDQLILTVNLLRVKRGIWVFDAVAKVDDAVVATAEIMCTEREIES